MSSTYKNTATLTKGAVKELEDTTDMIITFKDGTTATYKVLNV